MKRKLLNKKGCERNASYDSYFAKAAACPKITRNPSIIAKWPPTKVIRLLNFVWQNFIAWATASLREIRRRYTGTRRQLTKVHQNAQISIGLTYETGGGGKARNDGKAAWWYRKAADQGHGEEIIKMQILDAVGIVPDTSD